MVKRERSKSTDGFGDVMDADPVMARQHSPPIVPLPSPVPVPPVSPRLLPCSGPEAAQLTPLLVMKFGGSSLAGVEHLRRVAGIVRQHLPKRPVLVLSAMGRTTNDLLDAVEVALERGSVDTSKVRATHEAIFQAIGVPVPEEVSQLLAHLERVLSGVSLLKEVSVRTRDLVLSFGERLSVRTFEDLFNKDQSASNTGNDSSSLRARAFDSWQIGMRTTSGAGSTNSAFSQVEVLDSSYTGIASFLASLETNYSYLPVVTGYIAQDSTGSITTLGRDGSDLTATVIGAAVRASEVQIWKDVSGILTMDPRLVPSAKHVSVLTYEEAAELSIFGAKVVHPAAVMPAWHAKVPVCVRSSLSPDQPGTRIVAELGGGDVRESRVVAMSSKSGITMIVIRSTRMLGQHGFLARVFQVFDKYEASVDVITTSEITVSLTLDRGFKFVDLFSLRAELEAVATVEVRENMALLTLISDKSHSCIVLRQSFEVFESLGTPVEMISHGASNVNVTFVLPATALTQSTLRLHKVFFES
mmetsp:Transcript_26562/g.61963  ORF Transcript_26562/g.61963 Transcript_26562/m.61963 type:complete len:528 (+) Transcript_26562:78-1661(+)|eukprot:CAMPEP_0171081230 /NCGR_PEP_ID=MMETSP0766_2-20121228/16371_1 /TAXON_ID=439317 /ORGANISM="Gambierdiscus australes, Strain CAWD 149" /LENGTH=527 /DNA_ID=CAMNT_0011538523 /DNA_START=33 /DNA_END=1616 /DNA_ORIENTATION=+